VPLLIREFIRNVPLIERRLYLRVVLIREVPLFIRELSLLERYLNESAALIREVSSSVMCLY
jgi:hypothetical protein